MQGYFRISSALAAAWLLASVSLINSSAAETSPKPKLYNTTADGTQQIAVALKTAQAENKRLILKFGAEW
jgi:hypothetical protein